MPDDVKLLCSEVKFEIFDTCLPVFINIFCFSFSMTARNLYQFGNMVNCMTNRSRFSYSDYSCWCDAEGKGEPVDEVDKYVKIRNTRISGIEL